MRAIVGMAGLLVAGVVAWLIYAGGSGGTKDIPPPKQQIDVVAVRMDLLSLVQAEKRHAATNGSFATLEQLQDEGSVLFKGPGNHGYCYEINIESDQHFQISARPTDASKEDWPAFTVDETARITELK